MNNAVTSLEVLHAVWAREGKLREDGHLFLGQLIDMASQTGQDNVPDSWDDNPVGSNENVQELTSTLSSLNVNAPEFTPGHNVFATPFTPSSAETSATETDVDLSLDVEEKKGKSGFVNAPVTFLYLVRTVGTPL